MTSNLYDNLRENFRIRNNILKYIPFLSILLHFVILSHDLHVYSKFRDCLCHSYDLRFAGQDADSFSQEEDEGKTREKREERERKGKRGKKEGRKA